MIGYYTWILFGNDFKMSLGILENVKRAENYIRFDFKMILVT